VVVSREEAGVWSIDLSPTPNAFFTPAATDGAMITLVLMLASTFPIASVVGGADNAASDLRGRATLTSALAGEAAVLLDSVLG